jgi:hypothetical protein
MRSSFSRLLDAAMLEIVMGFFAAVVVCTLYFWIQYDDAKKMHLSDPAKNKNPSLARFILSTVFAACICGCGLAILYFVR